MDMFSPERMIQIKGTKEQIEVAKKEITALTASGMYGGKAANYFREQQQMMQMFMPPFGKTVL